MWRGVWALLLLASALTGCATASGPWVELKGRRFYVEVAADDESRARGLMFRDAMGADRGMLFVFEREEMLAFWMRNTRIPLDILYFDDERQLVSIAAGVPPCTTQRCPSYPSTGPARYVLEINAGIARTLGVSKGDALSFGPGIDPPKRD